MPFDLRSRPFFWVFALPFCIADVRLEYARLSGLQTVNDFEDLLRVMNSDSLSEFQYTVDEDSIPSAPAKIEK